MNQKDKIEELERRIRELEARPVYVPIYIGSPQPSYPCPQPLLWSPYPWQPSQPWWATAGGASQLGNYGVTNE